MDYPMVCGTCVRTNAIREGHEAGKCCMQTRASHDCILDDALAVHLGTLIIGSVMSMNTSRPTHVEWENVVGVRWVGGQVIR